MTFVFVDSVVLGVPFVFITFLFLRPGYLVPTYFFCLLTIAQVRICIVVATMCMVARWGEHLSGGWSRGKIDCMKNTAMMD